MKTNDDLINDLEHFVLWVESLQTYENEDFFQPISVGKWSISEIISHITFWDKYILQETIPKMKTNAEINSIKFQELNDKASEYALSGSSFKILIEELIKSRRLLPDRLVNDSLHYTAT
ncbi:hypothetical protein ELQ35_08575 [Peribacillus cavernae]|uniref:DinB family protein n=1 Tax=Peribacillus cavernae TaxID=1674310 RepID=A0A433HQ15_9BACI|nr:hypothetical protein [Peribacillus cavernae]MDQ0217143.1 hypothetical protein [Peribacillus cavernae]RUQ30383.1 hypothetical protein ELQ35_08575 [Peribacillus cavernae]